MGLVIDSYINLNLNKKPKVEQIISLLNELKKEELIDNVQLNLVENTCKDEDEKCMFSYFMTGEKESAPSGEGSILYSGNQLDIFCESIEKYYSKPQLILLLGYFHHLLKEELYETSAPILLFLFDEPTKPLIMDLYGGDEVFEDEQEDFGNASCAFIKVSAKTATPANEIMSSRFGKFLEEKFEITYETGFV